MGHLTAELPPQHLNRVQPWAVRGQVQQDQTSRGCAHDRFDLRIGMRIRVIPGDIDGAGRMLVDQGLQPFGDLPATFAASEQDYGVARMVVDGAQAIPLVGLPSSGNQDLLTPRAPHGAQGGQPTDTEFVSVVKHITGFQRGAGVFNRLFLPNIPGLDG